MRGEKGGVRGERVILIVSSPITNPPRNRSHILTFSHIPCTFDIGLVFRCMLPMSQYTCMYMYMYIPLPQAYLTRAAQFAREGRIPKAILNCNEAIRVAPQSARAFLYR